MPSRDSDGGCTRGGAAEHGRDLNWIATIESGNGIGGWFTLMMAVIWI
ncbi:MAG: hypothetical protein R3B67_11790 [Phycisphaerales bacterium]